MLKSILIEEPLQPIAIDLLSNLISSNNDNNHLLLIVDIFFKLIKLYPCKQTNTKTDRRSLKTYIEEVGKPKRTILDNTTYFQNNTENKNTVYEYLTPYVKPGRKVYSKTHQVFENQVPQGEEELEHSRRISKRYNKSHNQRDIIKSQVQ